MAAAPKTLKLPKSMGACADLLHAKRTARLAADKVAAALKAEEQTIIEHIIDNLDKESTGAAGKTHRVQVVKEDIPQLDTDNVMDFFAWMSKNKAYDCVQRRLSKDAIMARIEYDKNGKVKKMPPGVKMFTALKVSLTKVR